MELRDIEIFLTLAEELHFGRTAERLHVSQARVSQAVKVQERRIGARLFQRTTRAVALTPIGERLRDDLRVGYDAIQAGLARASAAAQGMTGILRLGVMGAVGHEIRDLIDLFQRRHPDCDLQIREVHFSDPFGSLRTDQADLVLLWRPVREPDLTQGPDVLSEGRVLAVATHHPLAERKTVSLEDLAGQICLDPGPVSEYWMEAMLPAHTPSGRPIQRGPRLHTFHEILTHVAAGKCVAPLNAHVLRYYTHPGVVYLPIHDAPPTEWALVWKTTGETAAIRAFVQAAHDTGPRHI